MAQSCAARYRARNPRATPLYRLFETHFDEVRGQWEERFERRCGFWRGFVDEQVWRYLDCGLYENGFARIRCPDCAWPTSSSTSSANSAAVAADRLAAQEGHSSRVLHENVIRLSCASDNLTA